MTHTTNTSEAIRPSRSETRAWSLFRLKLTSQTKSLLAGAWLGALVVMGTVLMLRILPDRFDQVVYTQVAAGDHIVFVVVASGLPPDEYVDAVRRAEDAAHRYADGCGCHFSTVGVATQSITRAGLLVLGKFGDFDEVDIGRRWFNSGLKRFTSHMGIPETLPQVIILRETVRILNQRDWASRRLVELGRFIGPQALSEWEDAGYPLTLDGARLISADSGTGVP